MNLFRLIAKIFKKPETKVINNTPNVNVTIVETPKPEKKLTVDEIVDALDKVQSSNDDVYTNVGLLVSEIKDVFEAENGDKRNKQKEDVFMTLKAIEKQVRDM